jgi:tryptophan synthase alpha chain
MTRIADTFARLRAQDRRAFVAYVMAGDPDFETSRAIVLGLPGAGVDVVELGVPFTDPDGGRPDDPARGAAGPGRGDRRWT